MTRGEDGRRSSSSGTASSEGAVARVGWMPPTPERGKRSRPGSGARARVRSMWGPVMATLRLDSSTHLGGLGPLLAGVWPSLARTRQTWGDLGNFGLDRAQFEGSRANLAPVRLELLVFHQICAILAEFVPSWAIFDGLHRSQISTPFSESPWRSRERGVAISAACGMLALAERDCIPGSPPRRRRRVSKLPHAT